MKKEPLDKDKSTKGRLAAKEPGVDEKQVEDGGQEEDPEEMEGNEEEDKVVPVRKSSRTGK